MQIDLMTGARTAATREYDESGEAHVFADGRWYFVNSKGILTDHLGSEPIQLTPAPSLAAFSPDGRYLAVVCREDDDRDDEDDDRDDEDDDRDDDDDVAAVKHLVILDRRAGTIVGKFAVG